MGRHRRRKHRRKSQTKGANFYQKAPRLEQMTLELVGTGPMVLCRTFRTGRSAS